MAGTLYLVATPIGNYDDMTMRGLDTLRAADIVVCEERKAGERLLRHYKIDKPIELLNEHNEAAASYHILEHLKQGKNIAVISDAGTPVFSDPGQLLVSRAAEQGIGVVPLPGASSLMPALTVSGFAIDQFVFYGWLSPKRERRRAELRQMQQERRTIVLMETPYRLVPLVRDIAETFGESRRLSVAFNLTMPDEEIFRGTAPALYRRFSREERKGEFVVVIEGMRKERGKGQRER